MNGTHAVPVDTSYALFFCEEMRSKTMLSFCLDYERRAARVSSCLSRQRFRRLEALITFIGSGQDQEERHLFRLSRKHTRLSISQGGRKLSSKN